MAETKPRRRSLDDIVGTWETDEATERALSDRRRVVPGMWRKPASQDS